ncbi:site-specific integrase [Methylobacterium sp. SD21]|uniref:tyrosine-type recombinase/integrase n=1 Tax=Methylobacterium litchii TaxID=3138810 RepID=UPI00313C57CD
MPRRADRENVVSLSRKVLPRLVLEPHQGERVWWDADLAGFGYRLRGDRATYVIRPPRIGGKSSLFTIGAADVLDVNAARNAARERLAEVMNGHDIRAPRRQERVESPASAPAVLNLGEVLTDYVRDAETRMRPKSLANLSTHVRVHFAALRDKPLVGLTRAEVAATIRAVTESSGPQAALRARRTLATIYAWAIGEGLAEFSPVAGTNAPARDVRRDRVLTPDELVAVWRACPADGDFNRIVRLLILTGQRRDEVAGMRWDEIDLDAATWRIPGTRTKNKRNHTVHLSHPALDILGGIGRTEERPFAFGSGEGPFSGFSRSKARLDGQLAHIREPWRLHDLRRSACTGMADIGVLPHVIEHVVNHLSGYRAGIVGIYQRQEYRVETRDALDRWGAHVLALAGV